MYSYLFKMVFVRWFIEEGNALLMFEYVLVKVQVLSGRIFP